MATTIKAAMDNAARTCRITPPSVWTSSTTPSVLELVALLYQTADELLERVDWSGLTLDSTVTGTGGASYSLPSDFKRLTRDESAVFETTPNRRRLVPITTNGDWTNMLQLQAAGGYRYYRIIGEDSIEFYRPLEDTTGVVKLSYVSTKWIKDSGGTKIAAWSADTDTTLLPAKLLEMGVVWRFRRDKGLVYADRQAEFEMHLSRYANDTRGLRVIDMTGPNASDLNRQPIRTVLPDSLPVL